MCQTLIENGAVIEGRDRKGQTPLDKAIESNKISSVGVLVEQGAEVNGSLLLFLEYLK